MRKHVAVIDRLHRKSRILLNGCVVWGGYCDRDGYGRIWTPPDTQVGVHRVAWEFYVGPIPEGHHIDHNTQVCEHRNCWAINHLQPVTPEENVALAIDRRGGIENHWMVTDGHTIQPDTYWKRTRE